VLFVGDQGHCQALLRTPIPDYVRVAFARLMQAYLDGLHVVVLHPTLCLAIEESDAFSLDERAAARRARSKYADHGGLRSLVRDHAVLVDGEDWVPQRIGQSWQVPIRWIAARPLHATHLLAEDLRDTSVLEGAGEDYRCGGRFQAFRVRVAHVAGGGGNTHRTLQEVAIREQRPVLCVVDSDKEYPGARLGPTAQACTSVNGTGLYEVCVTGGRELENSIPWRLLDVVRDNLNPLPSNRLAALNACQPDAAMYTDLKRGYFGHDVTRLINDGTGEYWRVVQQGLVGDPDCCPGGCTAPRVGDCRHKVVEGLGNTTLADVERHLKDTVGQPLRRARYLPSPNGNEWEHLGRRVFEAGIGLPPRRF
jgi:hypothetical protein